MSIAHLGLALPNPPQSTQFSSPFNVLPRCHSTASIDLILSSLALPVARSTASLAYAVTHRGCDFLDPWPSTKPAYSGDLQPQGPDKSTDHPVFLGSPPRIDRPFLWTTLAEHLHPSHQRPSFLLLNTVDALSTPASDSARLRQGAIDSAFFSG